MTNKKAKLLFAFGFFAYFSAYIGRSTYSAALPEIILDTGWDKSLLGLGGTMFFFSYAIGQLINGFLGDRLSNRSMIFYGLFLSSFSNFAMAFVTNVYFVNVIWLVNGFCLSMIWSPLISLFSKYLKGQDRLYAATHIIFSVPAGTIASFLLTATVLSFTNWRMAFFAAGVCVLISSLIWKFNVNNSIEQEYVSQHAESKKAASFDKMNHNHYVILVLVCLVAMVCGIIKDSVSLWVPTFLVEYYQLDAIISILTSIVLPLVNMSGVVFSMGIHKRTKSIILSTTWMFTIVLLFLVLLYLFKNVSFVLTILFLACSTSAMLGANSLIMSMFPMLFQNFGKTATITGTVNFCSYIASACASYFIGALSQSSGWDAVMLMWVCIVAIGVLISIIAVRYRRVFKGEDMFGV